MNLELIIQSGVSQTENDKYSNVYTESRNMVLKNLFAGPQWRKRIDLWTWGERGGKGEMYDNNVEIYVTLCKIDSQQEFVVCSVNLEGWGWR